MHASPLSNASDKVLLLHTHSLAPVEPQSTALIDIVDLTAVDASALRQAIQDPSTLVESDYTPESWKAFAKTLAQARTVLDDAHASQADVDKAVTELTAARDALVRAPIVDKSRLRALVDEVAQLKQDDYTPESWAGFATKLAQAKTVLDDTNVSQADVDKAVSELTAARDALVRVPVNKDALRSEIENAAKLKQDDYTPESWAGFALILTQARAVLDDADAAQADVDQAVVELTAARGALVRAPVNKDALRSEIENVAKLKQNDYTPDSWAGFALTLAQARIVLDDTDVSQADVDQIARKLVVARNALIPRNVPANKEALKSQVENAAKLKQDDYTPESWAAFSQALHNAQAVLTDPSSSQEQIDAANAALRIARIGLVVKAQDKKPEMHETVVTLHNEPQAREDDRGPVVKARPRLDYQPVVVEDFVGIAQLANTGSSASVPDALASMLAAAAVLLLNWRHREQAKSVNSAKAWYSLSR